MDTLGLLLAVMVTEANFPERLGGAAVVMEAAEATDNLVVIWVDQGFSGENFSRVIQQLCGAKVDVICRTQPRISGITKTPLLLSGLSAGGITTVA
jgi:putative transposase